MREKGKTVSEIREILRCYRITRSKKETARTLGCAKGTVKRYVRWAAARGYLESAELPTETELAREWHAGGRGGAPPPPPLEVHREAVKGWRDEGIVLTRIQEMLVERHSWTGSYESLKRFTRPMREVSGACVRIEVAPGAEAQVDFGSAGLMWDPGEGRHRRAWLFLMTLFHSRYAYGEFVFSQDTETWLACHRRAFEYFGGVPRKIVLDNLKAAIIKAALYDPLVNRAYQECAEHYGFLISPCLPGMPEAPVTEQCHKTEVIEYSIKNGTLRASRRCEFAAFRSPLQLRRMSRGSEARRVPFFIERSMWRDVGVARHTRLTELAAPTH